VVILGAWRTRATSRSGWPWQRAQHRERRRLLALLRPKPPAVRGQALAGVACGRRHKKYESPTRKYAGKPRWVNASATCGRRSCAYAVKLICRQESAVRSNRGWSWLWGWSWRRRGPASAGSIPWGSSSHASTLRGVGRPTGGLNAELLCVLGVQSLPAAELHRLAANDAADGSSAEKAIQNIETNVPPGSTH
jgi:hypothetical protein